MSDYVSLFTGMSHRDIGYLLKNIVQRSINQELTNTEISSIDNKTPVLLTSSKDVELMNDIAIQSTINIETPTQYFMPEEPDGNNLKIWLKFHNAGELRDWSYQKNKSYSVGSNTMPGLFYKTQDNSMLKSELYSYFDGINHYAYSTDATPIQILPNITANKVTSFFMRMMPISLAKLQSAHNNSLFTKADDDQLRYGYSVTIDKKGSIHFYVRNNYKQYHLFVKDAYASLLIDPIIPISTNPIPYRAENFNPQDFYTTYQQLCTIVDSEPLFDDWTFKYNPTTHNMSVIKKIENNDAITFANTSLVIPAPLISLPLQDGKYTHSGTVQTTAYDNSGNGYNGTISNIATGGRWNTDNTLRSFESNGLQIDLPSIAAVNTLTEFTIAFWYNPEDIIFNSTALTLRLVTKGVSAASTFNLRIPANTNNLRFRLENSADVDTDITFTSAFPNPDRWYFIVAKWKSGEQTKLSVNGTQILSSAAATTTITNSSDNLRIFHSTQSVSGRIALFKFYTTQISQAVEDDLYYQGYHNPLFPQSESIQPVPSETPDPIFIPFSNVYTLDKVATPVEADYRKINSLAGNNPVIERYNVSNGSSSVDPEVLRYSVPDGITTGGDEIPFSRIGSSPATVNSSDNSSGKVGYSENKAIALQIDTSGSGIGDTINGKVITKAIFWMRKTSSSITGTLYCRIWNTGSSLTSVATLGTYSANSLPQGSNTDDFVPITFTNIANTVAMANGYRIGIEYQGYGSSDVVDVQRRGDDSSSIKQAGYKDGSWSSNSDYEIKCDLYTGGTGTPLEEPWEVLGSGENTTVTESFGSTSHNLLNQIPRKIVLRLKESGTPAGNFSVTLTDSTGAVLETFSGPNVAVDLSSSFADYTFTNLTHNRTITNGMQIAVNYGGTGGFIHVGTNRGNTTAANATNTGGTNDYHGPTSYLRKYEAPTWHDRITRDVSMKVYTGGTSFDAYVRLSSTRTRVATKSVNSQSSLHNRKITKVIARIKKVGEPAGILNCYMRTVDDVIKVTYSSVDVSTIPANGDYNDVEFTNFVHTYLMNSETGSGDKIVYEFTGSDGSNYIEFNSNRDVFDTASASTITQIYDNGNYTDNTQRDLSGKLYEGGEPDLSSRTRIAQSIEHQDSILKEKKITKVKQWLYRTNTSTSGTVYCNIRRGTDDSLIKTLGTYAVSSLSSTVGSPTQVTFEDTTNNYPMNVGDKVTIEFNGGTSTNSVGVLVRNLTPTNYDRSYSHIRKYDETDYDDLEVTRDLCAIMDEGGFFFTPDPDDIPDPTPVNDKDLIICAGNNKKSGFFQTFLMEFRIYSKDITLDNADNLYDNRYSISPIGSGQILMPLSFKSNTLEEV